MSWRAVVAVLGLTVLVSAPVQAQSIEHHEGETISSSRKAGQDKGGARCAQAAKLVVQLTNEFRQQQQRPPVTVNAKLAATAQDFADFMARTGKYGHTADGHRPSERVTQHGYKYCIVAENIAYVYDSAGFATKELGQQFFTGWKNSPHHRKNMLDPDVIETGVAIARSSETGYYYAVQLFGRPKDRQINFTIANDADTTIQYKVGQQSFPLPPHYRRTHQVCRPPEITLQPDTKAARTLQPKNGSTYVVQQNGAGQLEIHPQETP